MSWPSFPKGEEISQDLAGMLFVGEGVDGWDSAVFSEFLDVRLGKGADDGSLEHAPHHAGGVFDGFATTELNFAGGHEDRVTAELADADFEADSGAGGAF